MIKIIKKGHERFNELCYKCGCEYEYTLDEIGKTLPGKTQCPCCEYYNEHKYFTKECSNLDVEDMLSLSNYYKN